MFTSKDPNIPCDFGEPTGPFTMFFPHSSCRFSCCQVLGGDPSQCFGVDAYFPILKVLDSDLANRFSQTEIGHEFLIIEFGEGMNA